MLIFKIVHAAEWRDAERACAYTGSAKDRADGFLHFSTAEQLSGTLEKYYGGASDLVLVCIEAGRLGAALKFEPSRDGSRFPHLYAALPVTAASWSRPIPLRADGSFDLHNLLEAPKS